MKSLKNAVLAASLFAAAGAASATAFSVTSATFTPGSGYGDDLFESTILASLLDVRFSTAGFTTKSFNLTTVGTFYEFTAGSVNFLESNSNQGIVNAETNNLAVSIALAFAAPGNVINNVVATGAAVIGSVSDNEVDFTLSWSPLTRTFGTTGKYVLSFANLSFANAISGPKDLVARVTLTAADAAAVPEPGSLALLGIGLLGAGMLRRRATK